MDDVLRGHLSTGYVSACLGTRRAPGLNAEEHAGIAELRVWLLIKSLEFTAAGTVHDASLRELANHLRHGLDGVDSDKLAWFRRIAVAAGARGPWEQLLQHRAVADAAAADWQIKVARSIQALLIDERRPIAGLNLAPSYHYVEESTEDELTPSSGTQWNEDEPLVLLGQGDEDDFVAEMSPVPAEAFTPAEAVVAARGIAMLGLEDRQFLPFSWNRPRPDEHLALMDMLGDALTASDNEKRTLAALALLSSHLDLISEYLRCCNWSWHEVDVYQRPKPHPRIAAALGARGIKSKRTIDPATKKKLLQIDVAVIELPGKLPVQTPAHAAVVRGRELVSVQDNYELIILWVSLSLSPPAQA